ncbi:MAG: cyclic nucleotide-binding domain-containing protein [Azospirillum sp.]|nr:cyclic nucleotide-binding domain-containing protein [Azospirillum sp.]
MSDELKFERKQVLALKGVDGQLHDTVITQGPKLQRFAFPAGPRIFAQNDPGDIAFVVESGTVSIAQHRTDGSGDVEIAKIGAGVMFGELALIDGLARTASATALHRTVCIGISPAQLDVHLQDATPELAKRLRILLAFVRAVPARAAWPGGVCPSIPTADLLAVSEAVRAGSQSGAIDPGTPFLRALYRTLCAYALTRFPEAPPG